MPDNCDIAAELAKLHILRGGDFIRQLKLITTFAEFQLVEADIYTAGDRTDEDFENLLNAARKATTFGYTVYILPNPKSVRTADFIFVRKGVFKLFDLKTIVGKNSVGNRLQDSIGQTNRVLLNVVADVNPMVLARSIRKYFECNAEAIEVLIFKGGKTLSIIKNDTLHPQFFKLFVSKYTK